MKYTAILVLLATFISGCATTDKGFQNDADIVRLNHLEHYGSLIEHYYQATGKYPFQGQYSEPVYVHVANDRQIKYTKPGPPYKHTIVPFKDFIVELERALGTDIQEFYDPQFVPDFKPNFYIYKTVHDAYFFAVHVHRPYAFSNKVADNYHKIEISNKPTTENQAIDSQSLFASAEFNAAKSAAISKPMFFKEREKQYLEHTKGL